jgi:hypothetical protein
MSKEVLLMEPTALQAFRTTSLLFGSGIVQKANKIIESFLKLINEG